MLPQCFDLIESGDLCFLKNRIQTSAMDPITIFGFELSPEKYEYLINIPKDKLFHWLESLMAILPNFAVAIITLLLFYPIAKAAKWVAGKFYRETTDNIVLRALVMNVVYLIVLFIGVFSALEILKLEKTVASLLAGAGVVGLAMGFAFQEIASNFVSGILISFKKPYRIDDSIEIQGKRGTVKSIGMRTTSIITGNGLEIIIPNKLMITEMLTNYSSTRKRKVEVAIGLVYGSDLEKAENVAERSVRDIPHRLDDKTEFLLTTFGESSINGKLSFWVDCTKEANYDQALHQTIVQIKKNFEDNAIEFAYPTRVLINQK